MLVLKDILAYARSDMETSEARFRARASPKSGNSGNGATWLGHALLGRRTMVYPCMSTLTRWDIEGGRGGRELQGEERLWNCAVRR